MANSLDDLLKVQQTALGLRARRQEVLAANIANADTPNFKARDMDFKTSLQGALSGTGQGGSLSMSRTSQGHMAAVPTDGGGNGLLYRTETQSAVDGNTVDMDVERGQFAENTLRYEASVTIINHLLRSMQSATQG
jgi:flagellar basal-body rod protein FlgB